MCGLLNSGSRNRLQMSFEKAFGAYYLSWVWFIKIALMIWKSVNHVLVQGRPGTCLAQLLTITSKIPSQVNLLDNFFKVKYYCAIKLLPDAN